MLEESVWEYWEAGSWVRRRWRDMEVELGRRRYNVTWTAPRDGEWLWRWRVQRVTRSRRSIPRLSVKGRLTLWWSLLLSLWSDWYRWPLCSFTERKSSVGQRQRASVDTVLNVALEEWSSKLWVVLAQWLEGKWMFELSTLWTSLASIQ